MRKEEGERRKEEEGGGRRKEEGGGRRGRSDTRLISGGAQSGHHFEYGKAGKGIS